MAIKVKFTFLNYKMPLVKALKFWKFKEYYKYNIDFKFIIRFYLSLVYLSIVYIIYYYIIIYTISLLTSLYILYLYTVAAAKSLQLCPTLCDPVDGSPPGSPIPRILQARTLEWVAISFSNAWKWKVKVKSLSRVQLSATPWTAAYQAPPSMGFSRQEY